MRAWHGATILILAGPVLAVCNVAPTVPDDADAASSDASTSVLRASSAFPVAGSAVHYFSTAVIHSQEPVENGMIQKSTDIVHLTGDLSGYLVFHATSTFDFTNDSLVNTGTQFFSGTVAGSAPVVLHDDRFRFVVDLSTGATHGEVFLGRSNDAPDRGAWYECALVVVGTGAMTPEGDGMVDYTGECTRRGQPH